MAPANPPPQMLLSRRETARVLGLAHESLRQWAGETPRRGPQPLKLSPSSRGRVVYRLDDVQAFAADPVAYNAAVAAQGRDA